VSDLADLFVRLAAAEEGVRLARAEAACARRRAHVAAAVAAAGCLGAFALGGHTEGFAQGQQGGLAALAGRVGAVEQKTASISVLAADDPTNTSGAAAVRFTGVNVQIVNGLGATNGYPTNPFISDPALTQVNGAGNLILG